MACEAYWQRHRKFEILYVAPVELCGRGGLACLGRWNDVRKEIKTKKFQIYTIDSNSPVIIRNQEVCYE